MDADACVQHIIKCRVRLCRLIVLATPFPSNTDAVVVIAFIFLLVLFVTFVTARLQAGWGWGEWGKGRLLTNFSEGQSMTPQSVTTPQ